jgi:hypothetical protein
VQVGKFYELYEDDAQVAHEELDWRMTVSGVGHCRQVGPLQMCRLLPLPLGGCTRGCLGTALRSQLLWAERSNS